MTSIPVLLDLGHRLYVSLLIEAQMALADDDWGETIERLHEFQCHKVPHMQAESDLLYPRLTLSFPRAKDEIAQLHQDHLRIAALTQSALDRAGRHYSRECDCLVGQLLQLLANHCHTEACLFQTFAHNPNDELVRELAKKLQSCTHGTGGRLPNNDWPSQGRLH